MAKGQQKNLRINRNVVVCSQRQSIPMYFFKKWAIPGLFFFIFRLFNTHLIVNKCSIEINNFSDDRIRTADLWYWKLPLYQLSHNCCPYNYVLPDLFLLSGAEGIGYQDITVIALVLVFTNGPRNYLSYCWSAATSLS